MPGAGACGPAGPVTGLLVEGTEHEPSTAVTRALVLTISERQRGVHGCRSRISGIDWRMMRFCWGTPRRQQATSMHGCCFCCYRSPARKPCRAMRGCTAGGVATGLRDHGLQPPAARACTLRGGSPRGAPRPCRSGPFLHSYKPCCRNESCNPLPGRRGIGHVSGRQKCSLYFDELGGATHGWTSGPHFGRSGHSWEGGGVHATAAWHPRPAGMTRHRESSDVVFVPAMVYLVGVRTVRPASMSLRACMPRCLSGLSAFRHPTSSAATILRHARDACHLPGFVIGCASCDARPARGGCCIVRARRWCALRLGPPAMGTGMGCLSGGPWRWTARTPRTASERPSPGSAPVFKAGLHLLTPLTLPVPLPGTFQSAA